jgi:hypothetical protein
VGVVALLLDDMTHYAIDKLVFRAGQHCVKMSDCV